MPVSRLPWQRVYAGSTSLFEYPIGPFLLFRALALSSHRPSPLITFRTSLHYPVLPRYSARSFLRCVLSLPITFSSMYFFAVSRSCQLCIPALPHRIPATSSTEYFFTGPLLPPATLTSCDMHCGVSRIHAPRRNYLYDPALLIPSA